MCNRLPEINKNGDAGIFPVYYSLKDWNEDREEDPDVDFFNLQARPGTRPAGTALAEKLEGRLQGIRSSTRLHAKWSADFRSRQARLDRGGAQGGGSAVVHRGPAGGGEIYGVVAQKRRRG